MEFVVFLLAVFVFALLVHVALEERRVDALAKRVEQLEKRSAGFLPASYAYLSDLEDWATKKGK